MTRRKRPVLISLILMAVFASAGCDGVRFKFIRYPETPVVAAPPAGLSSSELAAIIAAIR